MRRKRHIAAAALLVALGDCTGDRIGGAPGDPAPQQPPATAAAPAGPPGLPRPPGGNVSPGDMTGRWVLASPSAGFCGMTFSSPAGAAQGAIAPEGGCPGNFFTSRKWTIDQGALVIQDHTGKPLASLGSMAPGRLEGQAASGQPVTLTR